MKPIYAKLIDFISFIGKATLFIWGLALFFGEIEINDNKSIVLLSVGIVALTASILLMVLTKESNK